MLGYRLVPGFTDWRISTALNGIRRVNQIREAKPPRKRNFHRHPDEARLDSLKIFMRG